MDSSLALIPGAAMILVGLLSLIRYRFVRARSRLMPAAAIRGRGGSGEFHGGWGGLTLGRSLSVLIMLGGGIVLLAGMLG